MTSSAAPRRAVTSFSESLTRIHHKKYLMPPLRSGKIDEAAGSRTTSTAKEKMPSAEARKKSTKKSLLTIPWHFCERVSARRP